MIKNFEEFTKVQSFGNGFTQWTNGTTQHATRCFINDAGVTRALVRGAFRAAERDIDFNVWTKRDALIHGLPC